MSTRLAVEIDDLAERIYKESGHRFNINSPKQLGDVLFNKMLLPKPMKYGKGKVVSTAQDVLEDLAETSFDCRAGLEYRQLAKLKSTYLDSASSSLRMQRGGCTRPSIRWARRRGGSFEHESESAEYSGADALWGGRFVRRLLRRQEMC